MIKLSKKLFLFYYNWFKDMSPFWIKLWKLLWLKVIIIVFFAFLIFPDILNERFENDEQRSDYVWDNILNPKY